MKIRLGALIVLLLTLAVLVMRNNERILDTLYALISPIKKRYIAMTDKIEAEGESYLMQKKTIDALRRENLQLHQKLLTQARYIEQLSDLYEVYPQLKRYASQSVVPVHTISYAKLHTFSRIVLTKPDLIRPNTIYGLIKNDTVIGIAKLVHRQLYGYLLSDSKCHFAVYVGKDRAPGIAEGAGDNRMIIRYIPKWYAIQPGDAVVTSGLDRIFPSSLPVGTVTKVQIQSAYKTATVRTLADLDHPKILFLIHDTNQTLLRYINDDRLNTISRNETNQTDDVKRTAEPNETNQTVADENTTFPQTETVKQRQNTKPLPVAQSVEMQPAATIPKKSSDSRYMEPSTDHSKKVPASSARQSMDTDIDSIIQTRDDLVQPEPPIENKPPKPTHKPHRKKHRKHMRPSPEPLDLF